MTTKDTITISVTLRNGHCFEHHPPTESREKQLAFFNDILNQLKKEHPGILTLTYPMALYKLAELSSIHFPDIVQGADTPPMGFHSSHD